MFGKKVIGGVIVASSVVALAATSFVGGAFAQADPSGEEATPSASVDTKELCVWYVSGLPETLVLAATDGMPDEYDGSKFDLTTTSSNIEVYVSGNVTAAESPDNHSRCTFYGSNEGVAVKAAIAAGGFQASASVDGTPTDDNAMDFNQGDADGSNLVLDITEDACRSGETGETDLWDSSDVTASSTEAVLATTFATLTKANTVAIQPDTAGQNSACTVAQVVSVSIPSDKTPTHPGKNYTFTGPQVTYSINILSE